MRNSSELAEPRRLPTACFGLVKNQETESYATQVVDSYPGVEDRGAQATREIKRKLNPFVEEREASATRETSPIGVIPPERTRGLTLAKPLSLEQFVSLITSHPGSIQDPDFNKTDIHPNSMSDNSKLLNSHESMCNYSPTGVDLCTSARPVQDTAMPVKSGEDLF